MLSLRTRPRAAPCPVAAMTLSRPSRRLILLCRYPLPGLAKTRLIPQLGPDGAASVHRRLVLRTLRTLRSFSEQHDVPIEVHTVGAPETAWRHWLGGGLTFRPQASGDLGDRMRAALEGALADGASQAVLVGSDCPFFTGDDLTAAFAALERDPVVLGPATDGGYWLIGLNRPSPTLFSGVPWGTDRVFATTRALAARAGHEVATVRTWPDVDQSEDLPAWLAHDATLTAAAGDIAVIIPALNEAPVLARTLRTVRSEGAQEVWVVDGGSHDDTPRIAEAHGARVLHSEPGRARQMNAGAARTEARHLLFLHADTELPTGWADVVRRTLATPGTAAGAFRFRLREPVPGRWWIEHGTHLRSTWGRTPYGDQAIFLPRATFEELGGYTDLPIMEDYDLVRRLRARGRVLTAQEAIQTSARRWQKRGTLRTTLINTLMLAGFNAGVAPASLARFYRGPAAS